MKNQENIGIHERALIKAIEDNDLNLFKKALKKGANFNSALGKFLEINDPSVFAIIEWSKQKCPNLTQTMGLYLLIQAVKRQNAEKVSEILNQGINPNQLSTRKKYSFTSRRSPLELAATNGYVSVMEALLKQGADPNYCDPKKQYQPIAGAIVNKQYNAFKLLLDRGVDVETRDEFRQGLLTLAVRYTTGIQYLESLKEKGISFESDDAESALITAAATGNRVQARFLIDAGVQARSSFGWGKETPMDFYIQVAMGNIEKVRSYLDQGVDINKKAPMWGVPLDWATHHEGVPMMKFLLDAGADIHTPETSFWGTPLHIAARSGHIEAAQFLLQRGADPNFRTTNDCYLETPLHEACIHQDNPAMIDLLLQHGAVLDPKDKNLFTPLLQAVGHGNLKSVELLLERGADPYHEGGFFGRNAFKEAARYKPESFLVGAKGPKEDLLAILERWKERQALTQAFTLKKDWSLEEIKLREVKKIQDDSYSSNAHQCYYASASEPNPIVFKGQKDQEHETFVLEQLGSEEKHHKFFKNSL